MSGHFIAQVSVTGWWVRDEIYAGGQHIATYENDLPTATTFFTHTDQLGTERVQTGVNGSSCETIKSLPFGDGMNTSGSCDPTQLRFTGKQRDWESNLDNFGARHYSSSLALFVSVDPTGASINKANPQSWNRYVYTYDSPLRMVDANGKWPTDIHNQIIDRAFPGLSEHQRQILRSSSYWMDHCVTCQSESNSYQHAMRSPTERPADALRDTQRFVRTQENLAQRDQNGTPAKVSDINDRSLSAFGKAAHTVADSTSPAHVDAHGSPLPWDPYSPSAVDAHEQSESMITQQEMDQAVQALRQAFQNIYGQAAAEQAATAPQTSTPQKPSS